MKTILTAGVLALSTLAPGTASADIFEDNVRAAPVVLTLCEQHFDGSGDAYLLVSCCVTG